MDNQHRKITGYRELTQAEIDLMNEIKAKGLELEALVKKVDAVNDAQFVEVRSDCARWSAIAKTDFQTGLMALTRAVAKPANF